MKLSGAAVSTAADIAKDAMSAGDLQLLFGRADLGRFIPAKGKWYGKADLASTTIVAAQARADLDASVQDGLTEFVRLVAERVAPKAPGDIDPVSAFGRLREAVRGAGFDLVPEYGKGGVVTVRVLPLDDPRAPLSDEISALQQDFARLSLVDAASCYRDAVDSFVDQRFQASNSQIRSMLEAVIVAAAVANGFPSRRQGDGGRAIDHLVRGGHLPENDGGRYVQGLWAITHTNGPHPGTSSAGEAHFRLHALTSAARYLIDRFFPATS
jgi:hypothetical protein